MIIKINKLIKILRNIHSGIKKGRKNVLSSYVLLKIIKQKMFCISIDEEMEIVSYEILEENEEIFEVLIKYDLFYNICKSHSEEEYIRIEKTKKTLDLYVGKNIFNLPYLENQIFPTFLHEVNLKLKIKVKTQDLRNLLNIALSTSRDDNPKHYLNGIFFCLNKNILNIFSFDGFRFSFSYIFIDFCFDKIETILPRNTALEFLNTFNNQDYTLILFFDNQVKFVTSNITLTSRIINDIYHYPKTDLNMSNYKFISLNTKNIKDSLNKISIFCNNESKIIFNFKNNDFSLNVKSLHEQALIKLESCFIDFEFKFIIFYTFLNDILKIVNGDFFDLIVNNEDSLTLIKENNSSYIYVINHFI